MMIEEAYAKANIQTAQELFDAIPKLKPLANQQMLTEIKPGAYKFEGVEIDDLPVLEWFQLFNLIGIPLPTLKAKKTRKRGKT